MPRTWPWITAPLALAATACIAPQNHPLTSADRAAIVTIHDFAPWLDSGSITLSPEVDRLAKQKVAWSHLLAYEYRGTARSRDVAPFPVSLQSEVSVHPNDTAARHSFDTNALGLKAGLRKGGAEVESVASTLDWGDEIDLFVIRLGDRPIGNGFVGRQGSIATHVLISGLYSSDPALFEALLAPKLRALRDYDPTLQ